MRFDVILGVLALASCATAEPAREPTSAAFPAAVQAAGVRAAAGAPAAGGGAMVDCPAMRQQGGGGMRGAARGTGGMAAADPERGRAIFTGRGNCSTCHGADARGTQLAPDLTDDEWLHGDATQHTVHHVIMHGVAQPKRHPGPMPPLGGAELTRADVHDLTAFVLSLHD